MCKGHRLIAGGGSGNSALVWDVESMKLVSKLPSQDDSSLRYQGKYADEPNYSGTQAL